MNIIITAILVITIIMYCQSTHKFIQLGNCINKIGKKNIPNIFGKRYLEPNLLFTHITKQIPSVIDFWDIEINKAYPYFMQKYEKQVKEFYQYNEHIADKKQLIFEKTFVILHCNIIMYFNTNYIEIYYAKHQYKQAYQLYQDLLQFRTEAKHAEYEINIVQNGYSGLELKDVKIKPTVLDISKWYNDDFGAVHNIILDRLNNKNDKGIVLLHGLAGTGKTTYLRYLIGLLNKKILFLNPQIAANLGNPQFIELLLDNPNSILVMEDAEAILKDRKHNGDNSVSNILNISDGLMSDFLNVQIICTFNSNLAEIDTALLRKGRLIARYDFGKLSASKAQILSNELGFVRKIYTPLTIAEITQRDHAFSDVTSQTSSIGFRTSLQN